MSVIATCQWRTEGGGTAMAERIAVFLLGIDIEIEAGTVGTSVLPGMTVHGTTIVVDPAVPAWPGDLLHEGGHIAARDPDARAGFAGPSDDPGEEMAAIAWSYAAVVELGIDPHIVFHPDGYRGGGASMADNFAAGRWIGVPMLAWWDMTSEPHRATEQGRLPYPHMRRWRREAQ
ncbi:hypothetical protein [Sphingomonas sp. SUN039]|uniref:hypothetical protein n=1 Tax=Sphingomonas sp. SUN039 TaxID=2937787 RepID=UPI0021643F5B|nr:hypothetical protein [Sphingomonas sp. SUN039]UVO52589.1 hypothetical protein M0209_00045 [Sphingomonas sp. SUN039]